MSKKMANWIQNHPSLNLNHSYGLDRKGFNKNKNLRDFFTVMNVSLDWDGIELIAMLEAKNYPFWTT